MKMKMKKQGVSIVIILIINLLIGQETLIDELTQNAYKHYQKKDYANAIILFENLLAEQEIIFDHNDELFLINS